MDLSHLLANHPRISADPAVMVGKPCIKGTRITVELILRKMAGAWTMADILDAYPQVTEADVRAAQAFAADLAADSRAVAAE